jgi:DNA-binding MarR family transcriptional regulator
MNSDASIEQARYIFSTGKLIHDQILKTQSRYLCSSEEGSTDDLSVSQLHMIRLVWAKGAMSMSELAEQMGVSPPSASVMVERLVGKGILSREHSTEDRRKVLVTISPHAVKRAEAIEASLLQFFVELVDKIGPETSQMWCDVLARIKSVLNQEAPSRAETPDR